jgi:hypothetical protein
VIEQSRLVVAGVPFNQDELFGDSSKAASSEQAHWHKKARPCTPIEPSAMGKSVSQLPPPKFAMFT